jgi:hypothetical protein
MNHPRTLRFGAAIVAVTTACVHDRAPQPNPAPVVVTPPQRPLLGPSPDADEICSEPDLERRRLFACGRVLADAVEIRETETAALVSASLLGDPTTTDPHIPAIESEAQLAAGLALLCPASDSKQRFGAALLQAQYYTFATYDYQLAAAYLTLAFDEPLALDVRHYALAKLGRMLLAWAHGQDLPNACTDRWLERLRELYLDRCVNVDSDLTITRSPIAEATCHVTIDLRCDLLIAAADEQVTAAATPAERLEPYLSLTIGAHTVCSRKSDSATAVLRTAYSLAEAAGEVELARELRHRHDTHSPRSDSPTCNSTTCVSIEDPAFADPPPW